MPLASPINQYMLPGGEGFADVWWKTGRIIVKTPGNRTGGNFSQIETIDPRGTATPLHSHCNEEEAFFVFEGDVALVVDGQLISISQGDYALVPRNTPHAYVARSERARMLITFSLAGFEQMFDDLGISVSEHPHPPTESVLPPVEEIVQALAPYGCEVLGPPPEL